MECCVFSCQCNSHGFVEMVWLYSKVLPFRPSYLPTGDQSLRLGHGIEFKDLANQFNKSLLFKKVNIVG